MQLSPDKPCAGGWCLLLCGQVDALPFLILKMTNSNGKIFHFFFLIWGAERWAGFLRVQQTHYNAACRPPFSSVPSPGCSLDKLSLGSRRAQANLPCSLRNSLLILLFSSLPGDREPKSWSVRWWSEGPQLQGLIIRRTPEQDTAAIAPFPGSTLGMLFQGVSGSHINPCEVCMAINTGALACPGSGALA